jgi:hypothetical protein
MITLPDAETSLDRRRSLRLVRPQTPDELHSWVRCVLGFRVPREPVVAGHDAPFDYLSHAYFEDRRPRDTVVWASRGSGKTQLAAVATLLDLLFKHGIQVRILGGSFEQSSKMHEYLRRLLMDEVFSDLIAGRFTETHVGLRNGSKAQVLSQSQRDVRGQRVHKLRCDEVEMFEPDVWEAAQLITRSGRCGHTLVHGSIEALSTMHRREGLMSRLIEENSTGPNGNIPLDGDAAGGAESFLPKKENMAFAHVTSGILARRIFRWNVIDVLEHCPEWRVCHTCALWDDCGGRAKRDGVNGFVPIDDVIAQLGRVGEVTWKAEMLCERPDVSDAVFPEFDPARHVFNDDTAMLPPTARRTWCGGIDFGFRAPTVLLWAVIDFDRERSTMFIVDELVLREHTTQEIIDMARQRMADRGYPQPAFIAADPAGLACNEHTGISTIALWRRAGFTMRTCRSEIEPGILAVRRRLKRADDRVALRIHSRCSHLIHAMQTYRYPPQRNRSLGLTAGAETAPMKDGADHACDALRYLVINLDDPGRMAKTGMY